MPVKRIMSIETVVQFGVGVEEKEWKMIGRGPKKFLKHFDTTKTVRFYLHIFFLP